MKSDSLILLGIHQTVWLVIPVVHHIISGGLLVPKWKEPFYKHYMRLHWVIINSDLIAFLCLNFIAKGVKFFKIKFF